MQQVREIQFGVAAHFLHVMVGRGMALLANGCDVEEKLEIRDQIVAALDSCVIAAVTDPEERALVEAVLPRTVIEVMDRAPTLGSADAL